MVRAKVKQSVQTKQYEWEVLDEKNEDMFEIETPGHNLLLLRNFHLPDSWQAFVTGTLGHVEFSDEMANLIPDLAKTYPLIPFLHMETEESETRTIFHPIKERVIQVHTVMFFRALIAIHNDILIRVLEFDDEKRKLACLEHLATRTNVGQEFMGLADAVAK